MVDKWKLLSPSLGAAAEDIIINNMYLINELARILPVLILVISLIMYIFRKRIFEYYGKSFGYIKSVIFLILVILPIATGMPFMLVGYGDKIKPAIFIIMCWLPALVIYLKTRKKSRKKAGLFFAMLGMGISVVPFIVYNIIWTVIKPLVSPIIKRRKKKNGEYKGSPRRERGAKDTLDGSSRYSRRRSRMPDENESKPELYGADEYFLVRIDKETGEIIDEHGNIIGTIM